MTDDEEDKELDKEISSGSASLPWHMRFLMRFFPKVFLRLHTQKFGVHFRMIDTAQQLFQNTDSIDVHPISGADGRGFVLVLDRRLSLWFFQDGDHFVYDGFEIGEYEKGDVTIFDRVKPVTDLASAAFLRASSLEWTEDEDRDML